MTFVDVLSFELVTLVFASVLLAYLGFLGYLAMRRNDAAGLRSLIRSASVPLGAVGAVVTILGVWGEMVWPLPGSYNILFSDVYLSFGLLLVVAAISIATSLKLDFVGLYAFIVGSVTLGYGWAGYAHGMTKAPLETLGLFGAFALAGILSFPMALIVERFLGQANGTSVGWGFSTATLGRRHRLGSRAVQSIIPVPAGGSSPEPEIAPRYRLPPLVTAVVLAWVGFMALSALAAILYLNTTVPAHLASPP